MINKIKFIAIIIPAMMLISCGGGMNNQNNNEMKNTFEEMISDSKPTVVDFYADWCAPCKIQAPIIDELANDMGEKVNVIKINVDNNKDIAQKYGIASIPTIMIFRNGEKVWKAAGVQQKHVLEDVINNQI